MLIKFTSQRFSAEEHNFFTHKYVANKVNSFPVDFVVIDTLVIYERFYRFMKQLLTRNHL